MSIRATIQDETSKLHEYIKDKVSTDDILSECLRQWQDEEVLEDEPSWEDKPLHEICHPNISEVTDLKKSYQWLDRTGLQDTIEALILPAQEQALGTKAIEQGSSSPALKGRCPASFSGVSAPTQLIQIL